MKRRASILGMTFMATALIAFIACNKSDAVDTSPTTTSSGNTGIDPTNNNPTVENGVPEVYKKIYGATDISLDGDYVVITCNGLPDHKTPYYLDTEWESALYEAYNGTNSQFHLNPNRITQANLVFRIPLNPTEAGNKSTTPMGPIGVSLNGVPFYNQYAAGGAALTGEINSFDQYNGHPMQMGGYHYHIEPTYLTQNSGRDALLGFLLDGYPVYGPIENGKQVSNGDLDAYHGHAHVTADFPDGIYHYHITDADPYLNGDGFFGVPGTLTQSY